MHIYIYTYIHKYIYTYIHIYTYTYIHIYIYIYIRAYICCNELFISFSICPQSGIWQVEAQKELKAHMDRAPWEPNS